MIKHYKSVHSKKANMFNLSAFLFGLFLPIITSSVVKRGDSSHWCCDIEVHDTYTNVSQVKYEQQNVTIIREVETNRTRICHQHEKPDAHVHDFFGQLIPKCRIHKPVKLIVEKLVPKNVTVSISQKGICPPEHTVCCKGYERLNDQCIESGTVNSPELQKLIDAGLVVG